jgi:hypothetical protein
VQVVGLFYRTVGGAVFILLTPEKIKLTALAKATVNGKITPFVSFNNVVTHYTDQKSGLIAKNSNLASTLLSLIETDVMQRSYMYVANISSHDLMLAKLSMSHTCKVYVSMTEFVDGILPMLDLLILTTSTRPSVEMGVWIPDEDANELANRIKPIKDKFADINKLIQQSAKLYNEHAPYILKQLQLKIRQINELQIAHKHFEISRSLIAHEIRNKLITYNIKHYSQYSAKPQAMLFEYRI